MAFVNSPPPPRYNIYFCGFIFCEVLNLLIVLFHFLLTHRFLHYRYFLYGFNVNINLILYFDVIHNRYFLYGFNVNIINIILFIVM